MSEDLPNEVQRWMAKRRAALIVSILRGETSAPEAARSHGLTLAEVEDWKDKFLLAGENALRSRPKDEEALREEQVKKLKQKVGELGGPGSGLVITHSFLCPCVSPSLSEGTVDRWGT